MEQETGAVLFQPETSNAHSTLTEQQGEFVYQIFLKIDEGQFDDVLEMLNTNGSGDHMLPELHLNILKRIVLRFQAPDSPEISLSEVLMNARLLGEDIPEETVQELNMAALKHVSETLVALLEENIKYMKQILEHKIKESLQLEFQKKKAQLLLLHGLAFFVILFVWNNSHYMCD